MSETMVETSAPAPVAPRGILRTKSASDVSMTSEDSSKTPTITFAPLPPMEERKRRNNRPIGLAGRAEMLRRSRRPMLVQHEAYEEEEYRPQREDDDIPLPDFGKMVKGLWRSMSRGKKDRNERGGVHVVGGQTTNTEEDGEGRVWMESVGSWAEKSAINSQQLNGSEDDLSVSKDVTGQDEKALKGPEGS